MDKTNKKTLYPCQQHRPKSTFYPFENHTRDSFLLSISGQVSVESIITLANIIIPIKHRYKKQTSSKRRNKIRSNGSQQNIWSVIIVHGWNGYKSWCDQRLLLHDYIHACVCVCVYKICVWQNWSHWCALRILVISIGQSVPRSFSIKQHRGVTRSPQTWWIQLDLFLLRCWRYTHNTLTCDRHRRDCMCVFGWARATARQLIHRYEHCCAAGNNFYFIWAHYAIVYMRLICVYSPHCLHCSQIMPLETMNERLFIDLSFI